ncbi:MAG: uroporphyrinogen-III C-methyltransferase [Planctomycetaceae bacterium]|nr:uroporphyrinogen-III C-methyltransferase [Planctomycetales bacterium]MCB9927208.1 uroporphyrinogen-III C-methyltransferase [Planctomycetaceae bacterium]
MTDRSAQQPGKVYLIGAGPGDPELITLRGVERLRRADVVLYDYLVNARVLEHARGDAELICLGKHGRTRIWTQSEINDALVRLAREGKTVARLKGGDPAVFARGAEEIEALVLAKISFEVVPGITTALAAGSYAGIPITHREYASAVALVTGHEGPDKETSAVDYKALAAFPGTLVFYMGITTACIWTKALMEAGKASHTPVAIIRRCSLPDQRRIACTLGDVVEVLDAERIRPPAIIVVGEVARLADSFSWFEKRPLFGQRVLVTRPGSQANKLCVLLEDLGAETIVQPAIEILPPTDWRPVDDAIARLDEFDWLVFSSSNGVRNFISRLLSVGKDVRALGGCKLAAIGPGTSDELSRYHLKADLQPAEFRAESLAAELSPIANGQRFLLLRASRGREVLSQEIAAAGGQVTQVVVYESVDVQTPDAEVAADLAAGKIHWVTVTSSAIARSLAIMFGDGLRRSKLASISPITSATLRECGFEPAVEASEYTMEGVVRAIEEAVQA